MPEQHRPSTLNGSSWPELSERLVAHELELELVLTVKLSVSTILVTWLVAGPEQIIQVSPADRPLLQIRATMQAQAELKHT